MLAATCETNIHAGILKILFLIDELNVGGTEKQLLWLCEKLPRNLFLPVIGVLRQTPYQKSLSLNTPIVNLNWQGVPLIKNFQLIGRIRKYLVAEKFDILQTQFVESEIYGSLAALSCRKRPVLISTRRNLYHWIAGDPWRFRIGRYLTRHVDHVLANSYAVEAKCADLESVTDDQITVIQNAVDLERFKDNESIQAKESLGFSPTDFVVGLVGNWRPVKGIKTFLAAAKEVVKTIPSAQFVLAGQGPQEKELRDCADQLGLAHYTSFIKNSLDIPGVISAMDVAVQSSVSESFSNVLLEYMAAGKAIVATRVGDAAAMIKTGESGVLITPNSPKELADAIIKLHNLPEWARTMAANAKCGVKGSWSEDVILRKYQTFYQEIGKGDRV